MARRFTRTCDKTRRSRELRRTRSRTEHKLWPPLSEEQLGAPFRTQYQIGPWFADYCCVPLRLVIEIDGPLHDAAEDAGRDAGMKKHGFDVMRFTVRQMDEEFDAVVAAIYAEIQLRLLRRKHEDWTDDGGWG